MSNAIRIGYNQHARCQRHFIHQRFHVAVDTDWFHVFIINRLVFISFDDNRAIGITADNGRFRIQVSTDHRQRTGYLFILHGIKIIMHGPGHGSVTRPIGNELYGLIDHPAAGVMSRQAIALTISDNGRDSPMGTLYHITGIATNLGGIFRRFGKSYFYFHHLSLTFKHLLSVSIISTDISCGSTGTDSTS